VFVFIADLLNKDFCSSKRQNDIVCCTIPWCCDAEGRPAHRNREKKYDTRPLDVR